MTTYNWPSALSKVLVALAEQSYPFFEVIVADDGSSEETSNCIQKMKTQYAMDIKHVWQPDNGFQAAKIRNKAVAKANGNYLIFLDGDCIPLPSFIARHVEFAETGWFVAGNRILLSKEFTHTVLNEDVFLKQLNFFRCIAMKKSKYLNRILPLLFLPFYPRKLKPAKWEGAKTCNLGLWKNDFINVNGFDETYQGWGHEDSDLIIRLLKSNIKRKEGRFALPVLHFWHEEQDRTFQKENFERFQQRLSNDITYAPIGISQYLGAS